MPHDRVPHRCLQTILNESGLDESKRSFEPLTARTAFVPQSFSFVFMDTVHIVWAFKKEVAEDEPNG